MTYLIMLLSDAQPRRKRVIENVLVNKRTVATLFWGMRYQILPWLGARKKMTTARFTMEWRKLQAAGLIATDGQQLWLTPAGVLAKAQFKRTHYQPRFQAEYLTIDVHHWFHQVLLATQVVSELSYGNRYYAPFSFDETDLLAVKRWVGVQQLTRATLSATYQEEMRQFLLQLNDQEADFMVSQFIGHEQSGESLEQLSRRLGLGSEEAWVMQYDLFAGLAAFTSRLSEGVLAQLARPLQVQTQLSASAAQTYQLFQQSVPLEQIGRRRRLKIGTVREHLLEAAIFDHARFPFDRLLSQTQQQQLQARYGQQPIDEWQFETTKDDSATAFFAFRLFQIMRSFDRENNATTVNGRT